jgi:signal transduction histidine kinase
MEVQKLAEPVIAEFGHTVTWDIPQGMPILTTDSKQLAKIIFSLVKNALQYTPKDSNGQVTVKAERTEDNKLRISVTDTGIGMSEAEIARLGEPFYRADHELVTTQKGYGLGIPVAMGFLALMDSKLVCESTVGQGSTFSFELAGMG